MFILPIAFAKLQCGVCKMCTGHLHPEQYAFGDVNLFGTSKLQLWIKVVQNSFYRLPHHGKSERVEILSS